MYKYPWGYDNTMESALMIIMIASLITFGVGILAQQKRGLGFFSLILSTCSVMGILETMDELGDLFLIVLFPMVFILMMSVVTIIRQGE